MSATDVLFPPGVGDYRFQDGSGLAQALADAVAQALRAAIESRGRASLLVSGGRSPVAFFDQLSRRELPWSKVTVGLVDERWVPVTDPHSNEGLVRRHLLQNEATEASFSGLYQGAKTVEASADQAERLLRDFPWPADVLVLGMGEDGHTASLFPGMANLAEALDPKGSRTCLATRAPSEPKDRLTLTLPRLESARRRFLEIHGAFKRQVLARALAGEPLPIGRFLQAPLDVYWCP